MDDYNKFAISVAREAGIFLKEKLSDKHVIDYKGEINIVTEADRMSEELIKSRIQRKYPHHDILAEESIDTATGSEFRWLVDPLDGTTNYAHGYPVFCVSIALEEKGEIRLGVIYNPILDEIFVAEKGRGAFLNNRKVSVSNTSDLSRSLLATGFPYDIRDNDNNNINYFTGMAKNAQAIRRAGSAALDMAYVAMGRFDGFWELKLMPWDTAAGLLLIIEAGGMVTDLFGGNFSINSPHVLATNGKIHYDMIDVLKKINRSSSQ
ncbi:MAG TPA: inositol monophosphatase family protein [Syntrophales bacterium]|nr:inositol monophosphatase family protein [Syntrophales bacterium]